MPTPDNPRVGAFVWCYGHARPEPFVDDIYHECYECKHRFSTEVDLITAHNAVVDSLDGVDGFGGVPPARAISGRQVSTCPVCVHDF